ncbi:MAG: periplasmic heavy metal sensor [Methanobacteriota archaeon]|nr:MAG: periplasmic heavy metal sensor [Euryarchaeota archaeon]
MEEKKMKITRMMIIVLLVFSIGGFAQRGRMHAGPGDMKPGMRMATLLDLSEEQQEKIANLKLEQEKEILPLRNQIRTLRDEIRLLKTADKVDLDKINKKIDQITGLQNKVMKIRQKYFAKIREILTPEQRTKMNLMIMKPKGKRHGKKMHRF